MAARLFRPIWNNIGTVLLAFAMSLAVWVTAVVADDPNLQDEVPREISLEILGLGEDMLFIGTVPEHVEVKLGAPSSVIERLDRDPEAMKASIDLSGLGPGEYEVAILVESSESPVRIVEVFPEEITITLERLASRTLPITPKITGQPALGYQAELLDLNPRIAEVSGPESLVAQIDQLIAELDVSEANETIAGEVTLKPVDADEQLITGLTVEPATVSLTQEITQSERYRNVAVIVKLVGQPANGYRLTNISVSPPSVTIFSSDPEQVLELPGFVQTLPLDISGATDDIEARLALDLEEGLEVVGGEQSVTVLVGVAAIESSIPVTIPVEVIGLTPGLEAEVSPAEVDAILAGPLSALDNLQPGDVRFYVDVTELDVGTYTLEIQVEILPEELRIESMTLETVEVTLTVSLTPTSTPEGFVPPTPTPTPQ